MIRREETGLTVDQYAVLMNQTSFPARRVTAYRADMEYTLLEASHEGADTNDNFDAAVANGLLVRVMEDGVDLFDLSDLSLTQETLPSAFSSAPGLVNVDATTLRLFLITDNVLWMYERDFDGGAWDEGTILFTPGGGLALRHIAPVTGDRVHLVLYDPAKKIWQFACLQDIDDTPLMVMSSIYWMYPIESLDAEAGAVADVINFVSLVPGNIITKSLNTQVFKTMEARGGVLSFKYRDESYSDHFEIELIDKLSNTRYRRGVKTSTVGDRIITTCFSVDGTEEFPIGMYRYYATQEGRYWSMGKSLDIPAEHGTFGVKVIVYDGYLYAVEQKSISRALTCFPWGAPPEEYIVDITDRVNTLSLNKANTAQLAITMGDDDEFIYTHPFIGPLHTFYLKIEVGYYENVQAEDPILVEVGMFKSDSFVREFDGTSRMCRVTGRDEMALMADESQSAQAQYWQSQIVGGDGFHDDTGTNYGGLRHTATQKGTFNTGEQVLLLRNNNLQAMAFNTFSAYIWNGSQSIQFRLSAPSGTEYSGLVFRAIDKDNLWQARYSQATDCIEVVLTLGALDTIVASSSPKVWAGTPRQWRWLRVDFRYAEIKVYSSEDGAIWSLEITYLSDGMANISGVYPTIQTVIPDRGFVGVLGLGYSTEDSWDFQEFDDPPITIDIPDWDDDDFDMDYTDPEGGSGERNIAVNWSDNGKLARTGNFRVQSPRWSRIVTPQPVVNACWDYHSSGYISGEGALGLWVAGRNSTHIFIYYISDVSGTVSVTQKYTEALTDVADMKIRVDFDDPQVIEMGVRTADGHRVYRTENDGDDWDYTQHDYLVDDIYDPLPFDFWHSASVVAYSDGIYFSDDGGTDTLVANQPQVYEEPVMLAAGGETFAYYYGRQRYAPGLYVILSGDDSVVGSTITEETLININPVNDGTSNVPMQVRRKFSFSRPIKWDTGFLIGSVYQAGVESGGDLPFAVGTHEVWFECVGINYYLKYNMFCGEGVDPEDRLVLVEGVYPPIGERILSITIDGTFTEVVCAPNAFLTLAPYGYSFEMYIQETFYSDLWEIINFKSEDIAEPNPDTAVWNIITPAYGNVLSGWTLRDDIRFIATGDKGSTRDLVVLVRDPDLDKNILAHKNAGGGWVFDWNNRNSEAAYMSRNRDIITYGPSELYLEDHGDRRGNLADVYGGSIGTIKGVLTVR